MINIAELQQAVDEELKAGLLQSIEPGLEVYYEMFSYQFGWEKAVSLGKGKRIRPLTTLLAAHAVGGDWRKALPAGAALEIMHNFSLIHDDIQDKSYTRRGKETIWVKWGEALAINGGDALLAYSLLQPMRMARNCSAECIATIQNWLSAACIQLTKGQFLDIHFENDQSVSMKMYFEMIGGKTCALLQTAMKMGAFIGGADATTVAKFDQVGLLLGQAFQVQDDWLGIWGDDALLGKSTASDLIDRKKSYPILLGLSRKSEFAGLWKSHGVIDAESVPQFVKALENDGVKQETETAMNELYQQTFLALKSTGCEEERVTPLRELMQGLISRSV
ncbi:MAG: polyprenyl synthetase family protein [Anaerolineaceae bacterium]|nr:polyprenyl synthetase family protein [Anaerolineaceae bacterium]